MHTCGYICLKSSKVLAQVFSTKPEACCKLVEKEMLPCKLLESEFYLNMYSISKLILYICIVTVFTATKK